MSKDIYDQARYHFFDTDQKFEYGRGDGISANHSPNRHTDSSRTEQDKDGDGLRGVDCSSFVWRGLKNAGYDVGNEPWSTKALYTGHAISDYSKKHFDVISAADVHKPGTLQQGDIIMLKSKTGTDQHVAIFKGYDDKGNIQFIGSQTSTGPAEVTMTPTNYFTTHDEVVGALRAKPEFRTHQPVAIPGHPQGHAAAPQHAAPAAPAPAPSHAAPHAPSHAAPHPAPHAPEHAKPAAAASHGNVLREGERDNADVRRVQASLKQLGYHDEHGRALVPDGDFGGHTKAAVERFQKDHGLQVDGVVGKNTLNAIHAAEHKGPNLDNAAHADNPLYRQTQSAVHKLDAQQGRTPDHVSDRLAAAGTVAARKEGMTSVDAAVLNNDGSKVYFVQGEFNSPFKQMAEVNTQQAINTSVEQSSVQWKQIADQQAAVQGKQEQQKQAPTPQAPQAAQPAQGM